MNQSDQLKLIYVTKYHEGLSSWRISVAELLTVARLTNASLAEPCVRHGRLSGDCQPSSVRLRDVFDIEQMKKIAPIVSPEVAAAMRANATVASVCMHHGNPKDVCKPSIWGTLQTCPALLAERAQVLEIDAYRRMGVMGIKADMVDEALEAIMFSPTQIQLAADMVRRRSFDENNYVVYQWRSETKHHHLSKCVQSLVHSKETLFRRDTPVLLVSDLTLEKGHQWGGIHRLEHGVIERALDELRAHNVTKIADDRDAAEGALDIARARNITTIDGTNAFADLSTVDLVFPAIWDAVIASNAKVLATCSGCQSRVCKDCMWQGNYAGLILQLRNIRKRHQLLPKFAQTHTCWPEKAEGGSPTRNNDDVKLNTTMRR